MLRPQGGGGWLRSPQVSLSKKDSVEGGGWGRSHIPAGEPTQTTSARDQSPHQLWYILSRVGTAEMTWGKLDLPLHRPPEPQCDQEKNIRQVPIETPYKTPNLSPQNCPCHQKQGKVRGTVRTERSLRRGDESVSVLEQKKDTGQQPRKPEWCMNSA